MTSTELHDSSKNDNNEEKEEEIEPKISFRAQYARKSHNNVEKKRKDKIALWINKISELLPKDPKKESKNGILEKAYHYMVHLKETNDKLIYGHADQVTGEQLRLAKKKISNLEETNAVYYKLLKMSGITPNNIPLDVMKPLPLKSTEFKQSKLEADKGNQVSNKNDSEDDAASDTTEVIRDEDIEDFTKSNNTHATKQNISMVAGSHLNPFLNKTPLLIVNQNQDQNAPRISLSNGSQLQIRPSPNVQILGNGALAIDSSGFNQGPIILGSTLLSPPQPTTLLMSNGQVLSLVNQPQPAFVYTPGAGFVLTSTPVSNSIDVPVKTSDQTEKSKKKTKLPVNDELAATATATEEKDKSSRPKKSRTYQKSNSRQVGNAIPADDVDLQSNSGQKNGRTTPASKSLRRPRKVPSKVKETANKLTISEVHLQNDGTDVSKTKRTRPTTVIERVADSPVKICDNDKSSSKNNGTLDSGKETSKGFDETLTNDLQGNDISADNRMNDYSFRQNGENGETACEQDQLPLLLSSLSDDHEISTESGHSVSNSSLPTFLSLSPSDHLTDFLSKTSDHNNTTRSPRYSSPINRINTNGQTSQTPSVIISDQSNLINESSNCHHLMGQNNKEGIYEGNNMDLSNKNMESETRDKDNSVSMCVDENYSNSIGQHHQTTNSLTEIGSRKSSDGQESTSSSTVPTVTTVTSLSSNVNAQSSSTNNSGTNQESISQRNFLPYSAESLIRQQPQQQSNNMPSSVPINSIHHVHSNVTVDQNIDYSNRGTGSTSSTNVSANNARPTISYSAERLIHSPPGEPAVSSNQSNRHKSHETSKAVTISSNNQSNSSTSNIYDQQYSIRNARGSTDLDSNISRIQSNNHHQQQQQQHHQQQQHQEHQHQQQQHIASTVYRPSPQSHDQRTNQDQLHSSRTDLNLNNNPANQPQQILQQQRNVYLDSHGHHHHHQQPQPLSQQPRGQAQSHHSQPNQANSNSQGQLKTTPTNESSSNNATSNSNNSNNANNGREHFNHPYPYSSMPSDSSTTGERNGNIVNFPSGQNENFIENSSQNNFLPPFAPSNNNCQPPFNPTNNRRPSSSSAAMLAPFPFSDSLNSSSFSSDPYNRQPHGASSGSNLTSSASFDANRRIVNSGHFVDNAPTTSNNSSSNYFMVHNHHAATSSLPTSNNPPIFSTSSTFPSLIPSSTNSNYDTNGYNLSCPPRPSSTINTTANISGSTNTLSNSNLHPHHHAHHHVFYSDSTVSSLPSMHNSRRQSESSPYSASTVSGKSTNNNSQSKTNNTANLPTTASKQAAKSSGSSSKATKKGSSNSASKSRGQSSTNDARPSIINNPSATSYPSITGFPPPIASSSSSSPSHALNRSVVTTASSALNASVERSADNGEPLFRPQSQSNPANSSQTSSNRSSGPSSHGLPHSSTFLSSFSFSNIFPEIGPINPNENFAMPGLSTIKFNPANHVLPHHPNPNAPFAHSSHSGPVDNSSGSMNDNSPHQNIYGHHSRIATPHHHNHVSFIPLIGTSPRTLK